MPSGRRHHGGLLSATGWGTILQRDPNGDRGKVSLKPRRQISTARAIRSRIRGQDAKKQGHHESCPVSYERRGYEGHILSRNS